MTTIKLSDAQLKQLALMVRDMLKAELDDAVHKTIQGEALLTTKQKAEQLGIKPATLRKWVREGKIEAVKNGTSQQSKLMFR